MSVDVDVAVVGSGFGGSVAALRLAEKGYSVTVFEAGRRFADDEFAETSWNVRKFLWAPALGCFGIQRIHKLKDVLVLAGAGVGGGSLVYANTLYVPPKPFFVDPQWGHITDWQAELAPFYDQAKRMLGVVEENPCEGLVESVMKSTAEALGVADTFRKTPVGVFFGRNGEREPDTTVADPYFGGAGPQRTGCNDCGSCMTGCRVGAKNTLVKNYLALAERAKVKIEPLRTVVDIRPVDAADPSKGYRVTTARSGAWMRKDRKTIVAGQVVMAAGAWGTQSLLHRLKLKGSLPGLSDRLGSMVRTNSEALLGAETLRPVDPKDGRGDMTAGVAITTSFHPDADTHVENCRYGKGSNLMGLLSFLLIDGRPNGGKRPWWAIFPAVIKQPAGLFRWIPPMRFSERTIIALVMQSKDNSMKTSLKRRILGPGYKMTSSMGHGEPNPYWIEPGHHAVRVLADELDKATGQRVLAGGSWQDLINTPITAHFLGGCAIGDSPATGVVDPYLRAYGHPGIHVVDGSAVSANLGVNPSLTITAQAERAFALWPNKGQSDARPQLGASYVPVDPVNPVAPVVPASAPGALRLPLTVIKRA